MDGSVPTGSVRADERFRRLVEINRLIVAELSLDALLRRVLESSTDLVGARHGALLVHGVNGTIEHFLHCGMDEATVAGIAAMPRGLGLLGAVGKQPLRIVSAASDHRAAGLPAGHPPITAFLGVPIESADSVYGTLYLTNPLGAEEFTSEDEDLLRALAATAGIAIQNVRLYEEARQRHDWLQVSSQVSTRLLAEKGDTASSLRELAAAARQLARADCVLVVLPVVDEPEMLEVSFTDGALVDHLLGVRYGVQNSVAWRAMQEGRGQVVHDLHDRVGKFASVPAPVPVDHAMVFPLQGSGSARGAVIVGRSEHGPFTAADLQMAEAFAAQVALAMEVTDARQDRERVALLEERARIAQELNDQVVQRLFAAGLSVQAAATVAPDAASRSRLTTTVTSLDETIRSIRSSIFDLREQPTNLASLRTRVLAVVIEHTNALGETPVVTIEARLEGLVDADLVDDVEAVLHQALTGLAPLSGTTPVSVEVASSGADLEVVVTDHGQGEGRFPRRSAFRSLRRRAERRGGRLVMAMADGGGLRLLWSAPLSSS